jgi:hypothetical protein
VRGDHRQLTSSGSLAFGQLKQLPSGQAGWEHGRKAGREAGNSPGLASRGKITVMIPGADRYGQAHVAFPGPLLILLVIVVIVVLVFALSRDK